MKFETLDLFDNYCIGRHMVTDAGTYSEIF